MGGMFIAFFPCFGSLNWLNIPFAIIGLIISAVALSKAPEASRGSAIAGLVLSCIAVLFGAVRLIMGGGIL